jgi:excisionase family DNA binding protein
MKNEEPEQRSNILHTILEKVESIEKMMVKKEKPFMNMVDAAKYLGISKSTLYTYTSKGVLPYYKMQGRRVYFKVDDLDAFIFDKNNRVSSQEEIDHKAQEWIWKNRNKLK